MVKYLIWIVLWLSPVICTAAIYQQTDKNGNTVYSDTPLNHNAEKVILPSISEVRSSSGQANTSVSMIQPQTPFSTKESIKKPYIVFSITSPENETTFHNQPVIPVIIKLEPELQKGDKIQLVLDGAPQGPAVASTTLALLQVNRGTHQLSATLLDNNQAIKQSNTITLYIHHTSINRPSS